MNHRDRHARASLDIAGGACALPRLFEPPVFQGRRRQCTPIAPTPAATCAWPTRASPRALSGWIHRKRDHGGLLFIDLRDHYGLTQLVLSPETPGFALAERLRAESVIKIDGEVVARSDDTINPNLPTGEIEVRVDALEVLSEAAELPVPVFGEPDYPEELRLKYRYLDLRRETLHRNIVLRSKVIDSIRRRMIEQGFLEFQTPILTASSPEGARDFLVPSRLHPGKFYALPQAPQQFKQLLMVSGFDRYFQIAPCFRDEAARADRSPGEFYQLDMEMSFATQDDVFGVIEPVMQGVFEEFADGKPVTPGAVPAHSLPRGDRQVRLRQAGPAQPDRDGRTSPITSAAAASASSPASSSSRRRRSGPFPRPAAARAPSATG